tara:strand:+ start:10209 stop:10607 length:399 start_codon:yes stop_codon:yes gene_type:complete
MKKTVTVRFPAPLPAEIKCPICDANKCKVCDWTGKIKVKVDAKVPIQRTHIIKYVAENMDSIAKELTRIYGLTPEIGTKEVIQKGKATYEIVQISSLGGACWVVNRLDELEIPRYFFTFNEVNKFIRGEMIE